MDTESIEKLLKQEGNFGPSDEIVDRFLSCMEEVRVKPRERLIDHGSVNTNVYCVKEGIIRLFHIEEAREITFGFATPGTIILSPHSCYMRQPAFLMAENCRTEARVLRMSKEQFDRLMEESHEFSRWMFNIAMGQLYTCEHKLFLIKGTARDKYLAVVKNRPEIIRAVSGNIIASYLGITPQYLSHLKNELADDNPESKKGSA